MPDAYAVLDVRYVDGTLMAVCRPAGNQPRRPRHGARIHGKRRPVIRFSDRSPLHMPDAYAVLDVRYVDEIGLALDISILWRALTKVLRRQGISREGHATAPEFVGSGDR
jgi:hypothetical protein